MRSSHLGARSPVVNPVVPLSAVRVTILLRRFPTAVVPLSCDARRIVPLGPAPQHLVDGIEPIGQRRRTWLQNPRRLDLMQLPVAHRGDIPPAESGCHIFRAKTFAA